MSSSDKRASRTSVSFQMFKDMECKEEYQKLKLAGFLRELHKLAKEEHKEKLRDSLSASTHAPNPAEESKPRKRESMIKNPDKEGKISLTDIDLTEITPEVAKSKIESLLAGRGEGDAKLDCDSVLQLAQAAVKVMGEQSTVVDLRDNNFKNITVVGDLHGSLECLKKVLELTGLDQSGAHAKEDQVVIFGGDYVDRGDHSLEVLATLLLLKLSHPDNVQLLRGNHEDSMTASIYGFREEIDTKYEDPDQAEEIWYEFGLVFASFPICARTHTAAIMHGGIPSEGFTLQRLNEVEPEVRLQLKTVVDPYDEDEEIVQGVMWSDPSATEGIQPNDRGGGAQFGPDITKAFLDEHDLKLIIRAHEPFETGSDHQDVGDGRGVVTVFSTSNYPNGEGTNLGAILHLDDQKGDYETVTFDSSSSSTGTHSEADQYENLLRMFVDDHRRKLTKSFRKKQDEDGLVSCSRWAKIVGKELDLPDIDWLELQPKLAPANEGGRIDWEAFIQKFSSKLPNKDLLEDDQLSLLHEHKDKFLNIFHLLDIDGSGTISKEEFEQGIATLNEQTGGGKLKNPDKLFQVFDVDGDGEISIEEFCKGLEQSAVVKGVTDKLDSKEVQNLQENHEMLLLAFKYLDTDKSGAIDREEFKRGIDLLNKRLSDRSKLGDPEELFKLLDADGNGEIDLNEFNQMFAAM